MRYLLAPVLVIFAAIAAVCAPCRNCTGDGLVGEPPILFPCPLCDGTGEAAGPPATAVDPVVVRRPAVVRVITKAGDNYNLGSGVLVARRGKQGIVLTNWHVVRANRHAVTVRWHDESRGKAVVLASDDPWDLAALLVEQPEVEPAVMAKSCAKHGDTLTIIGFGGSEYREASGPFAGVARPTRRHPDEFVEVGVLARQGDSGGPILNDRGELVGVLHGVGQGKTTGTDIARIRRFLAGVRYPPAGSPCANGKCQKP